MCSERPTAGGGQPHSGPDLVQTCRMVPLCLRSCWRLTRRHRGPCRGPWRASPRAIQSDPKQWVPGRFQPRLVPRADLSSEDRVPPQRGVPALRRGLCQGFRRCHAGLRHVPHSDRSGGASGYQGRKGAGVDKRGGGGFGPPVAGP